MTFWYVLSFILSFWLSFLLLSSSNFILYSWSLFCSRDNYSFSSELRERNDWMALVARISACLSINDRSASFSGERDEEHWTATSAFYYPPEPKPVDTFYGLWSNSGTVLRVGLHLWPKILCFLSLWFENGPYSILIASDGRERDALWGFWGGREIPLAW